MNDKEITGSQQNNDIVPDGCVPYETEMAMKNIA